MKTLCIVAGLATAIVMGCTADSSTGPPPEVALSTIVQTVPFKGTAQSIGVNPTAVTCSSGSPAEFTDAGKATQLGNFTGSHWICSGAPIFGPTSVEFPMLSSEAVWVAANGDQLWMRLNPILGGRTVFAYSGTFKTTVANDIIGGTGRFFGATGLVNVAVDGSFGDPSLTASLTGTISSGGSH